MVDGVADQMRKGVFDGFDDGSVEFDLLADHLEVYGFSAIHGQIADRAGELAPNRPDGLHAGLHYACLQLGGDQMKLLAEDDDGGFFAGVGKLHDLIAGESQLANEIYQGVEKFHVHADGGIADGGPRDLLNAQRLHDVLRPHYAAFYEDFTEMAGVALVLDVHRGSYVGGGGCALANEDFTDRARRDFLRY